MTDSLFKKTIFLSLLWHLAFLSAFRVSSGTHFPPAQYNGIFFWGSLLSRYDLLHGQAPIHPIGLGAPYGWAPNHPIGLGAPPDTLALDKNRPVIPVTTCALKPLARLSFSNDKQVWRQDARTASSASHKKKSVVMFYPHLPYHFLLYFKDRQAVHIELTFIVAGTAQNNTIAIKRKISSGNLEADLLTARYLSHYLFIQQMGFPTNTWQTVKIELSPKND
jgi:hypothetical protein